MEHRPVPPTDAELLASEPASPPLLRAGLAPEPLTAEALPEPYRALLAHRRDMTPTLEAHHGQSLSLRVLDRRLEDGWLFREVVLVGDRQGRPVEYGAIRIRLDALPGAAREEVLACRRPLGAILRDHAVAHASRPRGYFRVTPDARTVGALGLAPPGPTVLFGRRNRITAGEGGTLAEIVEVLPPEEG